MGEKPATVQERDRRGAFLALLGLAILLGGLYLSGWLFVGGKVPSGTQVADVDIGDLSPDEAEQRLESALADRVEKPIPLAWQGMRFELDPVRAGLRLDVPATVEEAGGGRSWNPLRMVDTLLSPDDAAPVIDVDRRALNAALTRLADQIDRPPAEPRISFDAAGRRTVRYPKSGHTVDREAMARDIVASYLRSDGPVQLRIDAVEPTADVDDINRAHKALATPATSGPIRLRLPNRTVQLTVPEFAPALSLRGNAGVLKPHFDVDRLRQTMAGLRQRVGTKPVNARVVLRKDRPAVTPSRPGLRLPPGRVAAAITPVLTKTGAARTAKVRLAEWKAGFTTADAKGLGIRRVVSSFVTRYPHAGYRNVNLGKAARRINGTVLRPGQVFSFHDTVGPPTRANGFARGVVRGDRDKLTKRFGGGISQLSTTVFNAAFFAGLEDVWHQPHGVYVDRYPVGREAMVSWPVVDLRFKNNTPHGVLIQAWIDRSKPKRRGAVRVRMWSTKHWDITAGVSQRHNRRAPNRTVDRTRPCQARQGQPGFDVEVYRFFRRANKLHHKETMQASYRAIDSVVCRVSRNRDRSGPRR